MLNFKVILVPVDLSDTARGAIQLATELARGSQGRLILLHVYPPLLTQVGQEHLDPAQCVASLKSDLESIRPEGVTVVHRVEEGFAVDEIARIAGEEKADLIVMGTHGRTGLMRMLMGSVAEGVLRKSPCPVLTVSIPAVRKEE